MSPTCRTEALETALGLPRLRPRPDAVAGVPGGRRSDSSAKEHRRCSVTLERRDPIGCACACSSLRFAGLAVEGEPVRVLTAARAAARAAHLTPPAQLAQP